MSVNEKMTAIADAIRGYGAITGKLNLDDMANGIGTVYLNGYDLGTTQGKEEGLDEGRRQGYSLGFEEGKKAEYDAFWDALQNYGNPANYYYKFGYNTGTAGWTDENFNPKYPIICTTGTTAGMSLFYANTAITDTKVPIEIRGSSAQGIFYNASKLVRVRKLTVSSGVTFQFSFQSCSELKELIMDGEIGQNGFDVHWSTLLNKASIESIINALSATTSGLTVTFSKTAVNNAFGINIDDESSWTFEWLALRGSKSNWTFSFV